MELTRRELAGALAAAAAAAAQTPADTREQLEKAAAERVRGISERLAKYDVPMTLEPAFSFHA